MTFKTTGISSNKTNTFIHKMRHHTIHMTFDTNKMFTTQILLTLSPSISICKLSWQHTVQKTWKSTFLLLDINPNSLVLSSLIFVFLFCIFFQGVNKHTSLKFICSPQWIGLCTRIEGRRHAQSYNLDLTEVECRIWTPH